MNRVSGDGVIRQESTCFIMSGDILAAIKSYLIRNRNSWLIKFKNIK